METDRGLLGPGDSLGEQSSPRNGLRTSRPPTMRTHTPSLIMRATQFPNKRCKTAKGGPTTQRVGSRLKTFKDAVVPSRTLSADPPQKLCFTTLLFIFSHTLSTRHYHRRCQKAAPCPTSVREDASYPGTQPRRLEQSCQPKMRASGWNSTSPRSRHVVSYTLPALIPPSLLS